MTSVSVLAGKPSEFSYKLSKTRIAPGAVVFHVRNDGKIAHTFKICSSPKGGVANACVGKSTPLLAPGKTATLAVTLKKGVYEYLCTVSGHAAAGMKGQIGVGMAVPKAAAAPVSKGPVTTVTVSAFEFGYKLSQTSIPKPGTVIFKVTNNGTVLHNFVFVGNASGHTPLLAPHATGTARVVFTKPGTYTYECSVGEHAEEGMLGTFTVK